MNTVDPIPDAFIPTRQSLLSRLRDTTDEESWKQFFEMYWKLIYKAAIKAGLSDAEAQDVVQETIIALTKTLPEFKYDPAVGSFKGYLLRLTSWRINDQLRARFPKQDGCIGGVADPHGFVPETYWNQEWQSNLVEVARERVKQKVNPKHYQIFDLQIDQGWPARKVADALRINTAFVYLVRHRVTHLLRKEIKHLQAEEKRQNENHRQ